MGKKTKLRDPDTFPTLTEASEAYRAATEKRDQLDAEVESIKGELDEASERLREIESDQFDPEEAADALLAGEEMDLSDTTAVGVEQRVQKLERQLQATEAARDRVQGRIDQLRDGDAKLALAADLKDDVDASTERVAEIAAELYRILDWQYAVSLHCRKKTRNPDTHRGTAINGVLPYASPVNNGRWQHTVTVQDLLNHLVGLAEDGRISFRDPRD